MNLLLWSLAVAGIVMTIFGRRLMIDDASAFSGAWALAIRCLPLADLLYLARFWESAKVGAFISIAGMTLMLPLFGKTLWEREHPQPSGGLIDGDVKDSMLQELRREQQDRLSYKEQKIRALQGRIAAWYESMESRRGGLTNASPSEVRLFNEEAAAYAAFNAVAKKEVASYTEIQEKLLTSGSQISDEQTREFLARRRPKAPLRAGALF